MSSVAPAAPADLHSLAAELHQGRCLERLRAELDQIEPLVDSGREPVEECAPIAARRLGGDEVAPGQPQGGEYRRVGRGEVRRIEAPDVPPLHRLAFAAMRVTGVRLHAPYVEHDVAVRVAVLHPNERTGGQHPDPELLGELARESGFPGLPRHELPAGKLPQAGEVRPSRTPCHQHPAFGIEQHAGDDVDSWSRHASPEPRDRRPHPRDPPATTNGRKRRPGPRAGGSGRACGRRRTP